MSKHALLLTLLAAALPAGCGGDDNDDGNAASTSPAPATTERPATPAPAGHIVFKRFLDEAQEQGVLVSINPDGSEEQQITQPDQASDDEPGWSPDGATIGFTRCGAQGCQVWTADADGNDPRRLDPKNIDGKHFIDDRSDPAYSHDGARIAFSRGWGKVDEKKDQIQFSEVFVMSARGKEPRRLTRFAPPYGGDTGRATWSPDGKRVAVARQTPEAGSDLHAVYVIPAAGGTARRVTPAKVRADDPSWSPDGNRILFRTVPPGENAPGGDLYTIKPDGSDLNRLTRSPDGTLMLSAAFSPDGEWIVFSQRVDDAEPDLYIMRADGSDVRQLTKDPLWDSRPSWGP